MKIEKINDNQIRCTLTKSDLTDREIRISELAYGSEKARVLFKDMMEQASYEYGFEAEDIPLMIEATPINAECIVLTVTKVEDPEELDTRFSRFSPSVHEEDAEGDLNDVSDEVMDLFQKVQNAASGLLGDTSHSVSLPGADSARGSVPPVMHAEAVRIYRFNHLSDVIRLAHVVRSQSIGSNSLYKDESTGEYRLLLSLDEANAETYNKLCNIFSEYGRYMRMSPGMDAYFDEHFELICAEHALQSLADI